MSDLIALLVIATAFGSLTVIGLVILLWGLFAAQRTSSVVACAVVAAILFAAQLGWIAFWHSFGVGFGGEGGKSAMIIRWGSLAAVVLVAGFLALKLPRAVGKAVEAARWWRDGAKVSAVIIAAYVLYILGIEILRRAYPPAGGVPPTPLAVWVTVLVAPALAGGLWRQRPWAWYAALACTVYAIFRIAWIAYPRLAAAPFPFMSTPVGVRLLLLVLLLGVLLFSNARKLCLARK